MENVKEKLTTILREHGRLSSQHYLEETTMEKKTRLKEADMADKDVQAPANSSADSAPANPLSPDASQNQKGIQEADGQEKGKMKEADMADKDTQATPTSHNSPSDGGGPLEQDTPQNSKEIQEKLEDEKKESADADADDAPQKERFREMEDDMHKLVDVVEALKNQLDEVKQKVEALGAGNSTPQAPAEEEPMAPHTESAILKGAFAESATSVAEKQKIGQALGRLIRG